MPRMAFRFFWVSGQLVRWSGCCGRCCGWRRNGLHVELDDAEVNERTKQHCKDEGRRQRVHEAVRERKHVADEVQEKYDGRADEYRLEPSEFCEHELPPKRLRFEFYGQELTRL